MKKTAFMAVVLLALAFQITAQDVPLAFINAKLIPIVGKPIDNGVLLVEKGKITAIGAFGVVKIPKNAVVYNVQGKTIMPGLVDSHSHIGEVSGADGSSPIQPEVRVLDGINARASSIQRAQSGGITSVNVMPGSGHLNSGQTLYLKLRDGNIIDDLLLYDADNRIMGGMKFANGTNPLRSSGGSFPGTRAKSAALLREQLIKAQGYRAKILNAGDDKTKLPPRDLAMEAFVEVLDKKRTVHFHTHRHDDILTVLRLQKEFGFKVVLQHVSEAWKVAEEIAKANVPSSIIMIESPGGKLETMDVSLTNGAALEKFGAKVGFHTDDYITDSRYFLRSAALAVRAGMSVDKALYGLTMANAEMMDLDKRVGSLEVGKDADFIVLSGEPLSVYTKVLQTFVEGNKVFDRENPQDYLTAVGGYGATNDKHLHLDCFEELFGGER